MTPLPPGSTVGIMGGGQLGRMLATSAARLGYRCHIFAPDKVSIAAEVAADFTCAEYHDSDELIAFAQSCDVVSYEFENVPVGPLELIKDVVLLYPPASALDIAQDRVDEKNYALAQGGVTAPFAIVNDRAELDAALEKTGYPAIIKTIRMGYDGKGQARVRQGDNLSERWHETGRHPAIAEGFVNFSHEFSILLVRGQDGEIRYWDTPHNVHDHGILAVSSVPAPQAILDQQDTARALASKMAEAMNYVGVLTCEFFATDNGPVFNEMAPRVHNSGHWTIEGAITSQFENHIRAICGLPLGDTGLAANRVEMRNLIGHQADGWQELLSDGANHLHLYGKAEVRDGRKMGHVTKLFF
ncbi:MAG: 5-(carboxyamino)imidazole ribonucleotide synthase [Parasphingorhabdus sp.]